MLVIKRVKPATQRGFTLIEILIAIVVVGVGLIGLAKLQAVSVGESTTADVRALIALQGNSLAAAMHSNIAFWGATTVNATFANGVVTDGTTNLGQSLPSSNCINNSVGAGTTGACTPVQIAAHDMQAFAVALKNIAPVSSGSVVCSQASTGSSFALFNCVVTVNWSEKSVATNAAIASAVSGQQVSSQSYQFMVQP